MTRGNSIEIAISNARTEELPEILALLDECDLPKQGLADHLDTTLIARDGMSIVGCAALELYQEYALLRSLAVRATHRKRGLGTRLTKATLDMARDHEVSAVYLLTETASAFFPRLGFRPTQRSKVPQKVQSSIEFTTLCPESAAVMKIKLA